MTAVTGDRRLAGVELSVADEQVLRELTERTRASGLDWRAGEIITHVSKGDPATPGPPVSGRVC